MSLFINLITLSRILLGAIIFVLLTRTEMYWIALLLFFIASITDYFDGYLARRYNSVSQIGEILYYRGLYADAISFYDEAIRLFLAIPLEFRDEKKISL